MKKLTPMMQQYMQIKDKHKDSLIFFRLGDFYELFFDDAIIAARELEIVLTGRECGMKEKAPMCGVPHHSVDTYIDRLISKGYKVAICEQIEDASSAVGIVKRDVVRVITPGTLIDTKLLDEKTNNYLVAVYGESESWGLAYTDISTGELFATELIGSNSDAMLMNEFGKVEPKEIIYFTESNTQSQFLKKIQPSFNYYLNSYSMDNNEIDEKILQIESSFNVINQNQIHSDNISLKATCLLLEYINETQKRTLSHINNLNIYNINKTMPLDIVTRNNLELTETLRARTKKGSLLWLLDKTITAMGGRTLKKWVDQPLIDEVAIKERLNAIEFLKENIILKSELKACLKKVYDIERISAKISYGSVNPRDLISLKISLEQIPELKSIFNGCNNKLFSNVLENIEVHDEITNMIDHSIIDDPPTNIKDGGIIKTGYNTELDELRRGITEGKLWITDLEKKQKEITGIKSLKVGFNKVFGYYIEVTKSNLHLVPDHFIRKQTLANCERYITSELKEVESKIVGAQDKIVILEYNLFIEIRKHLEKYLLSIQRTAKFLGQLDVIYSLAQVAEENNYIKPNINNSNTISIKEGRHPVVEKVMDNELFIPNNTKIDTNTNRMSIITGPNMAGKSTYMRQVALIVLMAQIGSFIPAKEAEIGIVDRIFTRVGASDDLSQGQSTFMVEMSEVAHILKNASSKSLLILDEVGRGTSTFDGLSIAWAIIEYINNNIKAKTFFSTHYHELTKLENEIPHVKNYRVAIKENGDEIVFLRKIIEGSADKSYGIQVANLAGLPEGVIKRSKQLLKDLEKPNKTMDNNFSDQFNEKSVQAKNHEVNEEAFEILKKINIMETTPIEAFNILYKLCQEIKSK
ncbi:DNA mismatch repair protein MutS [Serpentinicella sp. ANB-PHB4]|uniref:DNA mismatch repair protein MutS n=1 Tax=Serpentinicella sp. ANB-PHB4 TaxID=3074076 RepID=UPI0028672F1F|nr:DNA mismatch repair protein MutS [Serpentinicella sp. ANB-PHB4]MDR5658148.1 DNA mismatch repair protein MutS [Serpentinicella sp. ANB-PHB4]